MRHKQQRIGNFQTWQHGTTTGYKAHACRCQPCRAAMSAYQQLGIPKKAIVSPASTSGSWWVSVPVGQMTAAAMGERDRMRASKFGAGMTRSKRRW